MYLLGKDVLDKTFYLTSLFSELKTENSWTSNEIKLLLMIFKHLSNHRLYLPDVLKLEEHQVQKLIENVPRKISIDREEFLQVLRLDSKVFAREFKKIKNSLLSKKITCPSPYEPNNKKSERTCIWFPTIDYLDTAGKIVLYINEQAIDKLILFAKYTKLNYENVIALKNDYSAYSYLFFKILLDTTLADELLMGINEFKDKLGLNDKYSEINLFRKRVLDIIKYEINNFTDCQIDYLLIKEGRSFTKIKFYFKYKDESIGKKQKIDQLIDSDNRASLFASILNSWNIKSNKINDLETKCSLDVIQAAIDLTLEKEKAGEIKTTKAAIFLGILENKQLASEEQFDRAKKDLENQQDKKIRENISTEYDKLSSFILSNQDIIQSALTANTKHLPITDKDAIPIFKKIKSIDADKFRAYTVPILSFYHFESNSNVSSILSDIVDRSHYIEIEEYKDDMEIVQAYKKALDNIKEDEYITDMQKDTLRKEVL